MNRLLRSIYVNQINACLLAFVIGAAAIGLSILILSGIAAMADQQFAPTRPPPTGEGNGLKGRDV